MSKVLKQLLRDQNEDAPKRKPSLTLVPPPPPPPNFSAQFKPKKKTSLPKKSLLPLLATLAVVGIVAGVRFVLHTPEPVLPNESSLQASTPNALATPGATATPLVDADEKLNARAIELYREQKYPEALAIFMEIFERKPKNSSIAMNISMTLLKQGDLKKSRDFLKKAEQLLRPGQALAKSPKVAAIYNNLGAISIAEKNYGQAQMLLRKAIAMQPEYGDARLNLARVLELAGRPEDAITEYEAFLARPGVDPVVKPAVEKRLQKIKTFVGYLEAPEEQDEYSY